MSSFFSELKRRNVIRVGVTYVVASWVLLQIGDVLIGMLELPGWIGKTLVLILTLGFPIVLIFAWAFELTPEGLKADSEAKHSGAFAAAAAKRLDIITIGLVLVALAIFVVDGFLYSDRALTVPAQTDGVEIPLDASVAVLPFENISRDAENDPFTIGIHDDLLTQIAKIGSLKTISRTSVLPYRDTAKPLQQIASELGVATILEGGVQRAGDQVRINVQLIDAKNNAQLWAERYERQLTAANIFVIQSDIVKAIADALHTTLSPEEQSQIEKIPTENLAALEMFFNGRERLESRNTDGMRQATSYFEQAIALDPGFALAYVGLSDSYQLQEDAGSLERQEMLHRAELAVEKALEIDPQLGAAYTSLGGIKWTIGLYPEAEAMFKKSTQLSPNYSRAYLWYGLMLADQNRSEEAIALFEGGIELDPLSSALTESLGYALEIHGEFKKALKYYEKAAAINSSYSTSYYAVGRVFWLANGSLSRSIACFDTSIDRDRGARIPRTYLGLLFLDIGDLSRAQTWIGSALELAPTASEPNAAMAFLDYQRGNEENALRYARVAQNDNPYYQDARLLQTMALAVLRNSAMEAGKYNDARDLYEQAYPELLDEDEPNISKRNYRPAIDLASVLLKLGETDRANFLLDRSLAFIQSGSPSRLGVAGHGVTDAQIFALRGERKRALGALRQAIGEGWRGFWWLSLKNNPNFESLENSEEFKSMVREMESSMLGRQALLDPGAKCDMSAAIGQR